MFLNLGRSEEDMQFEVWDQTMGFLASTAPSHSIISLLWNRQWMQPKTFDYLYMHLKELTFQMTVWL